MLEWFCNLKIFYKIFNSQTIIAININSPTSEFFTKYHLILSVIILVLGLGIFFRANKFYNETKDPKMLIFGAGFLFGGLTYLIHVIYWHLFGMTANDTYRLAGYYYLLFVLLFFAASSLVSTFYISDSKSISKQNFRRNIFLILTLIFSSIIISGELYRFFFPESFNFNVNKYFLTNPSLLILNNILFILAALIYANIRHTSNQRILTPFIIGFLFLAFGEPSILSLMESEIIFLLLLHINIIIGFALILIGLKDFLHTSGIFGFKLKIIVFPAIILITFYTVFTTISKAIFNVKLPLESQYVFWALFIGTLIIEYLISVRFYKPIANLFQGVKELKPGHKPTEIPVISKDELGIITAEFSRNAELVWQNEMQLTKSRDRERLLREVIQISRSTLDIDQVLNLICKETGEIFKVQRVSISQHPPDIIRSEYRTDLFVKGLEGLEIDKRVVEFWAKSLESDLDYIAIDNINDPHVPDYLREFYASLGAKSVIGIPIKSAGEKWGGFVLTQTDNYRHWMQEEIDLLKTISSQIYTAIKQAELYSSVAKNAEMQRLSREIIEIARSTLDINQIKNSIVNQVGKFFDASRCLIRDYDEINNTFLPPSRYSEYLSSLEVKSLVDVQVDPEVNEYLFERMLSGEGIIVSNDTDKFIEINNLENTAIEKFIKDYSIKSGLLRVLITYKDKTLGLLAIHFTKKKIALSQNDIDFIKTIANQAGTAIYQAQLFNSASKNAERERISREIIEIMRSTLDKNEFKKAFITAIGKYFEVNRVDLSEYDPINQIFLPTDENSEYISSPNVPSLAYYDWSQKEADCYTNIMKSKNEMNIADIDNYIWANIPECSETEKWFRNIGIKSTYNIPILYGSELMGFFCIDYTEKKYEMKNEELDFIRILAKQCGIALYQSILYEKEKQTANRENLLRSITSNTLLSNNLEDAIRKSTAAIGKLFDADRACFMFYDNTRKTFSEILGEYRRIEDMPSTEGKVLIPKEYEQFMIEELFIKKNILIYGSENESEIPESFKDYIKYLSVETSIPIKTIVGAPILFKDKPIGIILITNTESFGQWSKEKLDFLTPITQQISVGINLFQLNERLCKTLNSERTIKDIALESRKLEDYNQVWNYLLDRLTDIFGVDRALNLYFTPDGNLCICNEIIKNIDQAYSLGQDISNVKNTLEFFLMRQRN